MSTCPYCKCEFTPTKRGAENRAKKLGVPLYCSMSCSNFGRRNPDKLTGDAAKLAKREYDIKYRAERKELLKQKKKDYYESNKDSIKVKHTVYRAKHMQRHVAYCQQPEYKLWKKDYDRKYLAEKKFGEFSEAALLLQDVEKELESRATRYEIYQSNGTLNKSLQRKRAL